MSHGTVLVTSVWRRRGIGAQPAITLTEAGWDLDADLSWRGGRRP